LISHDLVQRVVSLLIRGGTRLNSITFSGGEALLHPQLEHFIEETAQHATKITVVTNGLLLTEQKLKSLLAAGVSKIRLGVDSIVKDSSRPSTGEKRAHSIHDAIGLLLSSKVQFELNIVLTKFNAAELPALICFCKENRISAKFFEHVSVDSFGNSHTKAHIHSAPLVPFETFQNAMLSTIDDVTMEYSPDLGKANLVYRGEGFQIRYCHYLCDFGLCHMTGTRIDSTGSVFACMGKRGLYRITCREPLWTSAEIMKTANSDKCVLK
jgi:molybdenum cofactor biosynthesis enzyme MoaA